MNFELQNIVRANVLNLKPYSSARHEFHGKAEIFLDANENPFEAAYNRYPDPGQNDLKNQIAFMRGVLPDQLVIGNGSDELIDLLFKIFCTPGVDNVIIPQPTYGMYKVCARINDIQVRESLLTSEFEIDKNSIRQSIDGKSKIIFLCNPNNPTGNLLNDVAIKCLLTEFKGIIVVDEAYIDFANSEGFIGELQAHPNLVVLQTLSKAWGLAGLRIGIAFASREIINLFNKVKPPYNVSSASAQLAQQELQKKDGQVETKKMIISERKKMEGALRELPFVSKVFPSQANFLLVAIPGAGKCRDFLLENGIVVRDRSNEPLCEDCLRISIGTPEQNVELINVLRRFKLN